MLASLPRYLVAPFQRTQRGMDYYARMTDFAWLPFTTSDAMRVIAFVTLWSGVFPAVCVLMLIYYPVGIFVARTNLLGRIEPGPPTKPLLHRYCFTFYLPFHLLVHIILTFGVYSDVEIPFAILNATDLGGWFPGFNTATFDSPALVTHGLALIAAVVVLLMVVPYIQRERALREGVLTPWQMAKLFFGGGLNDIDFSATVRVAVGVHHATAPRFFGIHDVEGAQPPSVLTLPDDLPPESLFTPINGIDLLKEGEGFFPGWRVVS